MDISDGLVPDLGKLCRAAGVGARLDADAVPLSPAVRAVVTARPEALDLALTGGDDYQILAALPPERVDAYREALAAAGVASARVGELVAGDPQVRVERDGRPVRLADGRFQHF
jgi:thiamine-monophosphate kinase